MAEPTVTQEVAPGAPVVPTKSPFQSKTLWVNLVVAAVAFFPEAQAFYADHPQLILVLFAVINMALRYFTKSSIQID